MNASRSTRALSSQRVHVHHPVALLGRLNPERLQAAFALCVVHAVKDASGHRRVREVTGLSELSQPPIYPPNSRSGG